MLTLLHLLGTFVINLFKSQRRLEAENLFLRHQLNIALRRAPQRLRLRGSDRALLALMTWLWPSLLGLARVVQPDTILRWHRAGFQAYWRWKSRGRPGRARVCREVRELIRQMSRENPLWGADRAYGQVFTTRVQKMGIRDRPTSPRSPWQNPYAERLIGSLRRDCLDHILIFGERHLLRILSLYSSYYNEARTHLSLGKDAPLGRAVQRTGTVIVTPILSGLHHHYVRI